MWLKRGLHQLYDDVAREPIPEEILKLIQDDRNTPQAGETPKATDTSEAGDK